MRETVQRQADGASKAEQRIQLVVCVAGWLCDRKTQVGYASAAASALSLFVRHRR